MYSNQVFQKFLTQLSNQKKYKKYLKDGITEYDILKYNVTHLSINDIRKMYCKVLQKYENKSLLEQGQKQQLQENSWMINQLKIFVWTTICYCYQQKQDVSSLNKQGWNFLVSVFYYKPIQILQYQLLNLLKGEFKKNQKWTSVESQLLLQIVQSNYKLEGKWNQISKLFYLKSDKKYFRKPQKCREHWFNHINPLISHASWSLEQDKLLMDQVCKIGRKWSEISKILGGRRTQHMVKNRYKSLSKRFGVQLCQLNGQDSQLLSLHKLKKSNIEQQFNAPLSDQTEQKSLKKIQSETKEQIHIPQNIHKISDDEKDDDIIFWQVEQQNKVHQLMEINQQKFSLNYKRSFGLLSDMDDDAQKYVESFLF